jgi:uncharacterized membrane protein
MNDRLTLATATGFPFALLAFHVATGLIAFFAGFIALSLRKGGTGHRRTGLVFTGAMIASGFAIVGINVLGGDSVIGGLLMAYLVFTAFTAVRPLNGASRRVEVMLMGMAFVGGAVLIAGGVAALGQPGNQLDGVPAGMIFFLGTVTLLAATGDARMIRAGGIHGARRIARHLWRMCFALFIASGSFLLGQMRFLPEPIRILPLLFFLAVFPLLALLYWMWRVRLRNDLRGLMAARAKA